MTVSGCQPVIIGNVKLGGVAYEAGLSSGDRIVTVNGQNVSQCSAQTVKQLISSVSQNGLDIHIHRPCKNSSVCLTAKSSVDSLLHTPMRSTKCCSHTSSALTGDIKLSTRLDAGYDIAVKPKRSRCDGASDHGHRSVENHPLKYHQTPSVGTRSTSSKHSSIVIPATSSVPVLQQILRCEQDYVDHMRYGLERFSRPLLHSILSVTEHRQLFHNVEKVVAVSSFCLHQLEALCEDLYTETPRRRNLRADDLTPLLSVYAQRVSINTKT